MGQGAQRRSVRWVALGAAVLLALSVVAVLAVDDEPDGVRVALTPGQAGDAPEGSSTVLEATTSSSSTPSTSTTTTTMKLEPTWLEEDRLVAYTWEADLWLYGSSGRTYRLTFDEGEQWEHDPAFSGPDRLTFVSRRDWGSGSAIEEIDLETGRRRTVFTSTGMIQDYDWTADGSAVGLLVSRADNGKDLDDAVGILRIGSAEPSWLRSIGPTPGRGLFLDYDLMRVEWSPDGTKLLVVDTYADGDGSEPTLFVLAPDDGSDLVPPRSGTWAVWGSDSRTVYFTNRRALALDVATGAESPISGIGPAVRLALSPDGRLLAYDDGADQPAVHVHDLAAAASRRLQTAALAPVWWSNSTLLAGRTTPCPAEELDGCMAGGHGAPWRDAGDAWEIDLGTTTSTPAALASTWDAVVQPLAPSS